MLLAHLECLYFLSAVIPLLLLFCQCGGANTIFADQFTDLPFEAKEHLISYHTEGKGDDRVGWLFCLLFVGRKCYMMILVHKLTDITLQLLKVSDFNSNEKWKVVWFVTRISYGILSQII